MTKWLLLMSAGVLLSPAVQAQTYPNFTQGSMTSTTVTDTIITETIAIERMGGDYTSYSGFNITPSGAVGADGTTYSVTTAGEEFQFEFVERTAGVIETEDISRTIEQTSTKNSLSVFSQ